MSLYAIQWHPAPATEITMPSIFFMVKIPDMYNVIQSTLIHTVVLALLLVTQKYSFALLRLAYIYMGARNRV